MNWNPTPPAVAIEPSGVAQDPSLPATAIAFFTNRMADGVSAAHALEFVNSIVLFSGEFGGATATLEVSLDGANYVPVSGGQVVTPQSLVLEIPGRCWLRASITGATGSTDITIAMN